MSRMICRKTMMECTQTSMCAPFQGCETVMPGNDYRAAYEGAREDLLTWKRRALEAEAKVRIYDERIIALGVLVMQSRPQPK